MSPLELTRARDLPGSEPAGEAASRDARPPAGPAIDLGPLIGAWTVFAEPTDGLSGLEVGESGGEVWTRARGSGPDRAPGWERVPARVFADGVGGRDAWGLRATYDHGFERVELYGYLNRGLLAVEAATVFADGSGRSAYFTRAFMFRP